MSNEPERARTSSDRGERVSSTGRPTGLWLMVSGSAVRRAALLCLSLCTLFLGSAQHALAQASDYPVRPVRIVVPIAAGATNDIVARLLATRLADILLQPFLIENRPGGAQITGSDVVAHANADGYTLLFANTSILAIHASLFPRLPYDPRRDFDPVSIVAESPSVLVVLPSLPVNDLQGFIDYARAHPGKLNYGSPGSGSPFHLSMELFKKQTGTDLVHVPFNGNQYSLAALLGNQIQALFDNPPNVLPQIRAGKLHGLAVSSPQRVAVLPEVPTLAEVGFKGAEAQSFFAIVVPHGTPAAIVAKLNGALLLALKQPEVHQRLLDLGAIPLGNSPTEAASYIAAASALWARVVKDSGAQVDN